MKICVIGNSHIAALKHAWDELNCSDFDLSFVGAPSKWLKDLNVENGYLVPTSERTKQYFHETSDGLERINFDGFDALILHGLVNRIGDISEALTIYKPYNEPDITRKSMTQACIARIYEDQIKKYPVTRVVELIRNLSSIPLFISPPPFPSCTVMKTSPNKLGELTPNACQLVQAGYYDAMLNLCQSFQANFIPQPADTISDYLFTKEELSKGSITIRPRLSSELEETDYRHMNKDYGKKVLLSIFSRLSGQNN